MKNYWKMSDQELVEYAAKFQITQMHSGGVTRKILIDQLLAMENAKNTSIARLAMIITLCSTLINVGILIYNLASK